MFGIHVEPLNRTPGFERGKSSMTPGMLDMAGVESRLEQVERQNRWMKITMATLVVLAGSVFLLGQAAPTQELLKAKVIEADKYVLRDATGKRYVELEYKAFPGQTRVAVATPFGEDQRPEAQLCLGKDGVYLTGEGWPFECALGKAGLVLARGDKFAVYLGPDPDKGQPTLALFGSDGRPRVGLGAYPEGVVRIYSKGEKVIWRAP